MTTTQMVATGQTETPFSKMRDKMPFGIIRCCWARIATLVRKGWVRWTARI